MQLFGQFGRFRRGPKREQPINVTNHAPIEVIVNAEIAEGTRWLPITILVTYEAADPYAVRFAFGIEAPKEDWNWWCFARHLLYAGLSDHAGDGDVRVWPWRGRRYVAIAVSSYDGHALLRVQREVIVHFLHRTFDAVALGSESEFFDGNACLGYILDQED